ncbi:hypothetical protein [Spiroplasma endosymbiont of Danaus chrysippus]|uniref:hypothetical protein n=1 Tax=Spiroplasma endosymbiont of Danaus chrysippus TaxID=2691041 RepID=UPI00157ABFFD|nr:hypothetical protein [Spiroplasma endosymbiont of Danaus chrysippus]
MDKDQFQYAFAINTIGTEIPNLETTDKTVAGAINELKQKIKDKKFSNDYFKYNTETNEISLHDEENSLLCKDLLENNEYKLLKTQNKKLLQAINEILEKQPQPSPSKDNWKEIGTREKNKWDNWQITYDFQENKHYRVYYSWSIYNPVYTIQEFIITNKKIPGVQIQTFNDSANAVYFINQTSLKGQINNQLTTKNYSLNWIFDKSNNLVAIYYNNWKNTNNIINDKINYSFSDWHNGTSIATDNSNVYNILKWSNYARDWNTFTNMYPTFSFINSYFKVSTSTGIESSPTLATNTAKIEQYKNPGNANVLFIAYINTKDGGGWGIEIALNLDLWHDNDNIYFQWYCFLNSSFGRMTYVNIALNNINFHNIMNN